MVMRSEAKIGVQQNYSPTTLIARVPPSLGIPDESENISQIHLGYILGYISDISWIYLGYR
jgi:hypothetical protein